MIAGDKIRLREKRLLDAQNDYAWQTDPELVHLDATPPLTISFPQYLSAYADELHYPAPTRHLLAIETPDGKHIGNCVYYNTNETEEEAELGIMIGDSNYWGKGYGSDAIATLVNHVFSQTELERLYLKTLSWNQRAQKCFQKCGFTPCGHLHKDEHRFVLMELYREQWEKVRQDEAKMGANCFIP